jgi:membrane-bound lytic murein transglycosylase B
MTATPDRMGPSSPREELRLVELASGLLILLDAYRLTGRLPLEVQVQASRLRHAVKLAIQAEAARTAGARYRIPWTVLAAIGKVESNHGRAQLPGVHSGSNWAGACGPMQLGCVPGSKAGNAWARYGRGRPHDPTNAIPAAARYLVDYGARHNLDRAIYAYNHSWAYVARVKALARRYARGGGRR